MQNSVPPILTSHVDAIFFLLMMLMQNLKASEVSVPGYDMN